MGPLEGRSEVEQKGRVKGAGTRMLAARVPLALGRRLARQLERSGRTVQEEVRRAVSAWLASEERAWKGAS